jgi:predicted Abi (CAAX) family protease
MMVNRRRKGVLTKGAVIDVVIGLGVVAEEYLVEGLVIDPATGSKRLLSISVAKIKTKESCCWRFLVFFRGWLYL